MFGNIIGLSEFWDGDFRWKDIILACFCLQIGNDNPLKPNDEICLKCEYQLKQKTTIREEMLLLIKRVFLENVFEVSKP